MMKYPIVETFASIQGEGRWTGTPMYFIRFAGCPVSRSGACTSWDGTVFRCDTDVQMRENLEVEELVERAGTWPRICLTGGEPFLHDLDPLMRALDAVKPRRFHIETSGCLIPDYPSARTWLTVSPKRDYLRYCLVRADEVKVLVGQKTDMHSLTRAFRNAANKTYVQPIHNKDDWDETTLHKCIEFLLEHPTYTLSTQLHKVIGVR